MASDSTTQGDQAPVDHVRRGRLLRWYRSQAGMSLREFSRQAGVNHSIVSRIEQGSQHAPPRVISAYRELLGVDIHGSEVFPTTVTFDLTIEVGVYFDECKMLRLIWTGQAERHRIKPDLIFDAADWPEKHEFGDTFGRVVQRQDVDSFPSPPYRSARPVVMSVPKGWVDAFAPFEEAWRAYPPREMTAFRFALPLSSRVRNFRLKFFLHTFNRTIVWFDDKLIARPDHRMTVIDLGPLEPGDWHKLSWGRLNNADFGSEAYLYGNPRERERAAEAKGWIQVDRDLWENEHGVQKPLDEIS